MSLCERFSYAARNSPGEDRDVSLTLDRLPARCPEKLPRGQNALSDKQTMGRLIMGAPADWPTLESQFPPSRGYFLIHGERAAQETVGRNVLPVADGLNNRKRSRYGPACACECGRGGSITVA